MDETPARIGEYEIEREIGRGGMGVVYLGLDSKLHRPVAIKTLPAELSSDPERLSRFEREARVLASLNHTAVAGIHGIEQDGESRFLVLEYVDGDTLSDRIRSGPIPMDEALHICAQIAQGVEAAHEAGIVHRDLKPANIKIDPSGEVKVLDFGLAKVGADPGSSSSLSGLSDKSDMPTLTMHTTQAGVILGTTGYMSPEQARGRRVDKRSDIFSFGCILYECLTGQRAFDGETATDTITAIVSLEPDWALLPDNTPTRVVDVLHRCLEKNAKDRLRDIGDARIELERAVRDRSWSQTQLGMDAPKLPRPKIDYRPWAIGALAGLILGIIAMIVLRSPAPIQSEAAAGAISSPIRFDITSPTIGSLVEGANSVVAVSPDGSTFAVASAHGICIRTLDDVQLRPIPGAENGYGPFFSPNGQWIAFFANDELKKITLEGGTALTICDTGPGRGGAWLDDDTIVFASTRDSGLLRVSSSGGEPEVLTRIDESKGEAQHRWPAPTSDPNIILMTVWLGGSFDDAVIDTLDLTTGERQELVTGGANAHWMDGDRVVFLRQSALHVANADLKSASLTGSPHATVGDVCMSPSTGAAHFDVSRTGDLIYLPAGVEELGATPMWIDRKGKMEPVTEAASPWSIARISPDQRFLAFPQWTNGNLDLWQLELERASPTRLTFEGRSWAPIWAPDGQSIAYASTADGSFNVYTLPLTGSPEPQRLTNGENHEYPESFTPDGRQLIIQQFHPETDADLHIVDVQSGEMTPLMTTPFAEHSAQVSPDGRWIVYVSNESGAQNVYAQRFPGLGSKVRISANGGVRPQWGPRGLQVYYFEGNALRVVTVSGTDTLTVGQPETVATLDRLASQYFDISPDGRKFLVMQGDPPPSHYDVLVELNWSGAFTPDHIESASADEL